MSFDLYAFQATGPMTAAQAADAIDRFQRGDVEALPSTGALAAFLAEVIREYPALESKASNRLVAIQATAEDVALFVAGTAAEHGLVCYDPLGEQLIPEGAVPCVLSTERGEPLDPVAHEHIVPTVEALSDENYFAVLERFDGWFAQVGYGPRAGAEPGWYALEFQEGSVDQHYRTETEDPGVAAWFLIDFLYGLHRYRGQLSWYQLER
jgi:hypothetical protein